MIEIEKVIEAQEKWHRAALAEEPSTFDSADEALKRCSEAIAVLRKNLNEIGYPWTEVERCLPEGIQKNVSRIENAVGSPIPRILTMFWERIGGVSLVDIQHYQHILFWNDQNLSGPNFFCDGLHIDACSDDWTSFVCDDFLDWKAYRSQDEPGGFLLELSPDGFHKDSISGGEFYGLYPGENWLPTWQNFKWPGVQRPVSAPPGPPDFLSYLRSTILECAGFPALLGLLRFNRIRESLLRDVPIF